MKKYFCCQSVNVSMWWPSAFLVRLYSIRKILVKYLDRWSRQECKINETLNMYLRCTLKSVNRILLFFTNIYLGLLFRQYMCKHKSWPPLVKNKTSPKLITYIAIFGSLFLYSLLHWKNFGTIHPPENIHKTVLTASKLQNSLWSLTIKQPTTARASQTDKEKPNIGQGPGMWVSRIRLDASQNFAKFLINPPPLQKTSTKLAQSLPAPQKPIEPKTDPKPPSSPKAYRAHQTFNCY